jgi:hypothetical protein
MPSKHQLPFLAIATLAALLRFTCRRGWVAGVEGAEFVQVLSTRVHTKPPARLCESLGIFLAISNSALRTLTSRCAKMCR